MPSPVLSIAHLGVTEMQISPMGLAGAAGIPSLGSGLLPEGERRGGEQAEPLVTAQRPLHDPCVSQEHR